MQRVHDRGAAGHHFPDPPHRQVLLTSLLSRADGREVHKYACCLHDVWLDALGRLQEEQAELHERVRVSEEQLSTFQNLFSQLLEASHQPGTASSSSAHGPPDESQTVRRLFQDEDDVGSPAMQQRQQSDFGAPTASDEPSVSASELPQQLSVAPEVHPTDPLTVAVPEPGLCFEHDALPFEQDCQPAASELEQETSPVPLQSPALQQADALQVALLDEGRGSPSSEVEFTIEQQLQETTLRLLFDDDPPVHHDANLLTPPVDVSTPLAAPPSSTPPSYSSPPPVNHSHEHAAMAQLHAGDSHAGCMRASALLGDARGQVEALRAQVVGATGAIRDPLQALGTRNGSALADLFRSMQVGRMHHVLWH